MHSWRGQASFIIIVVMIVIMIIICVCRGGGTFISSLFNMLYVVLYIYNFRYVRQGVLYGMGMLLWATPHHVLMGNLAMGVAEAVSWMKEVAENDPDHKSRTLAAHALGMLSEIK